MTSSPAPVLESWPLGFSLSLALVCRSVIQGWGAAILPVGRLCQHSWVLDALLHRTRGMAIAGVAAKVCEQVEAVLRTITPGKEAEHMMWILEFTDFRCSEVRLTGGTIVDSCRHAAPYPAFVWNLTCVQSYSWAQSQHINVLGLVAS